MLPTSFNALIKYQQNTNYNTFNKRLLHRCYHVIFSDGKTHHHVTIEWHTVDHPLIRAAAEAERLLRTKLYSHLRKIPVRIVLEVSVHRREQQETEVALRELMGASNAFGAVPTSQATIDALEKTKLCEDLDSGDDGRVICKDEILSDEEVVHMPYKHMFHHECIVRWLSASNLCPLSRFHMPTRSDDCD
ncbi:RING-type domain-containing protein [Psidium guajava]|nr:RING-type domain-containing protein [Psidium guajava]